MLVPGHNFEKQLMEFTAWDSQMLKRAIFSYIEIGYIWAGTSQIIFMSGP